MTAGGVSAATRPKHAGEADPGHPLFSDRDHRSVELFIGWARADSSALSSRIPSCPPCSSSERRWINSTVARAMKTGIFTGRAGGVGSFARRKSCRPVGGRWERPNSAHHRRPPSARTQRRAFASSAKQCRSRRALRLGVALTSPWNFAERDWDCQSTRDARSNGTHVWSIGCRADIAACALQLERTSKTPQRPAVGSPCETGPPTPS